MVHCINLGYNIVIIFSEAIILSNNRKDSVNVAELYGEECILPKEDFLSKFNIKPDGLSNDQVIKNISMNGYNILKHSKEKKWYHYLLQSLISPFNIILICISIVLLYTDVILADTPNYANIIVILILVVISTLLEFFQDYRSNKAAAALRHLVETTSTVIRNGNQVRVPVREVTVGDVVLLSAGDMIPADLRLIESKDLYVGQSSLTGESDAIKKNVNSEIVSISDIESITDLDTICFMGTNVVSGSAKGVVIKIGDSSYFGRIADSVASGKPDNNFQKGVKSISKLLINFMLVMLPITFLLNVWKHDILTAFTFSVAIAIGITPLLLPVILSSSLSRGAVKMSKKKTIVKKLDSIQSFGAMNILCTDKTGTLTEDKIVLEKYLDIKGKENPRILKHAFLNSYFQTGLKSNIDEAVIKRAEKDGFIDLTKKYIKIDEIPFDFSRRRLSIVVSDGEKTQLITKGAVEEILGICTMIDYNGEVSPITNEIKNNIMSISKEMNKEGLRVVAICQKNVIDNSNNYSIKDESKMVLLGFIGFLDPPKESAKNAIDKLNKSGIRVIVLTGDNAEVTRTVCDRVNINSKKIILGSQIEKLNDFAVLRLLKKYNIFAKLSPIQKERIIKLLKQSNNTVGFMGDGINDSPSIIGADVGISVDTAVDIAKESADIILLEKDLNVLNDGVLEGRRTFCNLIKYIKLAISFNFGEVMSVLIASVFLPFLPITPIQLLVQSLLYDIGQLSIPFDNVDNSYLEKPRQWNINSLKNFMLIMGPTSSIFDLIVFITLWFGFGLREPNAALFQTIWFTYGIVSNLIGLHIIRTSRKPFIESNASKMVYFTSIALSIIAFIVPGTFLGQAIGLIPLPTKYIGFILLIPLIYCFVALIVKKFYIKKYGEWI